MELTQLKYFLNTANCGQITQAAEMLHISPSAISTAISRLEEELGVPLFRKSGRNITLTENGLRFATMIKPAIAELDFARNEMLLSSRREPHTVTLAIELPDLITELEALYLIGHPDARFHQTAGPTEDVAQKLRCNSVDFGLTFTPSDDPDIISELILDEPVYLQVSRRNHLASRKEMWLMDASEEGFISFNAEFSLRRWMDGMCYLAGFHPRVIFEVLDTQSIQSMVETHNAVSFIGKFTLFNLCRLNGVTMENASFASILLKDQFCRRMGYLCYHRNRILSDEAKAFLLFCRSLPSLMKDYSSMDQLREIVLKHTNPPA